MHWNRIVHAFLLGTGLSVVGVGCAAVDALVSSPAGRGANGSSTERLVAVGRVFENQGRMTHAQAMYRQALKADPGNSVAKERMEFIASMNSSRTFSPSELRTKKAIVVADSLQSNKQIQETTELKASAIRVLPTGSLQKDAVLASLDEVKQKIDVTANATETEASIADDSGRVEIVDTGWELAEMEGIASPDSNVTHFMSVLSAKAATIETVGFESDSGIDAQIVEVATVQVNSTPAKSAWKASSKSRVTFAELSEWIENPIENQDNLLRALKSGEDDGVKALAAAMLTECSLPDQSINDALVEACHTSSPLLKVTSRDTLIQRGAIDEAGVNELLSLLTDIDADIRAQAAASLRNCAGTEWTGGCVTGLELLLKDSQPTIVAVAASTLGDFGADAAGCTHQLEKLLQSDDQLVSEAALVSLNRVRSHVTEQTSQHHLKGAVSNGNDQPVVE